MNKTETDATFDERSGRIAIFFLTLLNHMRDDIKDCIDMTNNVLVDPSSSTYAFLHSRFFTIFFPVIKGLALLVVSGVNIYTNYTKDKVGDEPRLLKKYHNTIVATATALVFTGFYIGSILCSTLIASSLLASGLGYGLVIGAILFDLTLELRDRRLRRQVIKGKRQHLIEINHEINKLLDAIDGISEFLEQNPSETDLIAKKEALLNSRMSALCELRVTEAEIEELTEINKLQRRFRFTTVMTLTAVGIGIVVLFTPMLPSVAIGLSIASLCMLFVATTSELPRIIKTHRVRKAAYEKADVYEDAFKIKPSNKSVVNSHVVNAHGNEIPLDGISLKRLIDTRLDDGSPPMSRQDLDGAAFAPPATTTSDTTWDTIRSIARRYTHAKKLSDSLLTNHLAHLDSLSTDSLRSLDQRLIAFGHGFEVLFEGYEHNQGADAAADIIVSENTLPNLLACIKSMNDELEQLNTIATGYKSDPLHTRSEISIAAVEGVQTPREVESDDDALSSDNDMIFDEATGSIALPAAPVS